MIEIGRAIISRDIFEEHFVCDLLKCKGACCVEGDSGAPLTTEEADLIKGNYDYFKNLNDEHGFFGKVVPLPHPRWVMQYRRRRMHEFVKEYLQRLEEAIATIAD